MSAADRPGPRLIPFPGADATDAEDALCSEDTRLVDAAALAHALGVHPAHVRRLARAGRIPSYRVGRALRFDLANVKQALLIEIAHAHQDARPRNLRGELRRRSGRDPFVAVGGIHLVGEQGLPDVAGS